MTSMRDIKRRKGSIESTKQITKAMKLVSTVKLQKTKERAEEANPYFSCMYQTVKAMLARSAQIDHPYLTGRAGLGTKGSTDTGKNKTGIVLITANRGLAGGYNANLVRIVTGDAGKKDEVLLYTIGTKGRDALEHLGYPVRHDASEMFDAPAYADAAEFCKHVLGDFTSGEIAGIDLVYTHFKNTVVQEPLRMRLLPVDCGQAEAEDVTPMNYEPDEEEVIEKIIPLYLSSLIYGALMDAAASENAARMQAMEAATGNAEEMIEDLTLQFNRARQSSITQELTEIIAGAQESLE
ncbi:MAG: ATP synthase F1 subunit gamma [Lachnospiraceae bacterium]|nr:ATP synthase F1 subunit gamma [Lachnospiraceae bacterium]